MAKRKHLHPDGPLSDILATDFDNALIHVCLASWDSAEDFPEFQRLQVTDDVTAAFRDVVQKTFTRLRRQHDNHDLVLHPYEAGAKLDTHEIEYLPVGQYPAMQAIANSLESVNDLPLFENNGVFLGDLHFYVIVVCPQVGHRVLCFRSCTDKIELGRSRFFAVTHRRGQYDRVTATSFIFDRQIDCFCGSPMFILNKDRFQRIFRYYERVQAAAHETLDRIRTVIPIHNGEEFANSCEGNLQMLKKLKNIAAQPYLDTLTIDDMKKVIEDNDLRIETTITDGQEQLVFDPTQKWTILKMLDDDYLKSVMTGSRYEVNSKRTSPVGE